MGGQPLPRRDEIEHPEFTEQRRSVRKRVLWAATLETETGHFDCVVVNLSLGGAKLCLATPLAQGQTVTLALGRFGSFRAEVVWQRGDAMGLRFIEAPQRIATLVGGLLPLAGVPD